MNVKQTIFQKNQAQKAKVAAFRERGLCIQCGKNPATLNRDGTQSVRCDECRQQMTRRKQRYRTELGISKGQVDIDNFETPSYLDTAEFASYCTEVLAAIVGRSSIGDMRRAMGCRFNERWHQDAIEALQGVNQIAETWGCKPMRWERATFTAKVVEKDSVKENEWRRHKTDKANTLPTNLLQGQVW